MRWIIMWVVLLVANPLRGDDYWPAGKEWAKVTAVEAGMDPAKLQAAVDYGMAQKSGSVLVLRHGKIVSETYAADWKPEKRHEIASAAKSYLSILAGMALDEGKFKSLDQSAADFIPAWKGTDKSKITLRHLLTMTSGLSARGLDVRGIKGNQFALNSAAALDAPPGTKWSYNTPAYHLMFHLIAQATGESFESYAQRKLLGPLGMDETEWVMNTGTGNKGSVKNYYSASCSARDFARFGLFAMYGGRWNGKQLVSTEYFKQATTSSQELNPFYGFLWWVNAKDKGTGQPARLRFPGCPPDTFAALGAFEQDIFVVPSLGLVVVRQGSTPPTLQMGQQMLKRIVESVQPGK